MAEPSEFATGPAEMITVDPAMDPRLADPIYHPTAEEQQKIADSLGKYKRWRKARLPYEPTWLLNAAFDRGNQYAEWDDQQAKLKIPKVEGGKVQIKVNRFQAKLRARTAKFLKNRPKPIIVPATSEYEDYANAKTTQKAIDYVWRRQRLEKKVRHALHWSRYAGKGFWWLNWDPLVMQRIMVPDEMTGEPVHKDEAVGDVLVEVGSPFEIFVPDMSLPEIGMQPEVIRAKMRPLEEVKQRHSQVAHWLKASSPDGEMSFTYERQIARLSPRSTLHATASDEKGGIEQVLCVEHLMKPNAKYPQGCYRLIVGDVLVIDADELPMGMVGMENPYPVVEFFDTSVPGQFWPPTIAEQLIDIQREYNMLRSKVDQHLQLMVFPKLLVAKQHQVAKGAWSAKAGEIVEYTAAPNLPPPVPWYPPPINSDVWRTLELNKAEFDDITQIYPVSEGAAGATKSGFQVNLLQEATDAVHGPDIRQHELSIEEATQKIRRIMKQFYDQPRLLAAVGKTYAAEIFEFSASQIDEMADIVVEVGSALPTLKAAKQESVLMLFREGLIGDPTQIQTKKTVLGLLEMGGIDEAYDLSKDDETQARLENKLAVSGQLPPEGLEKPHLWEDHEVHVMSHSSEMKGQSFRSLPRQLQEPLIMHYALHLRMLNPMMAMQVVMEEGLAQNPAYQMDVMSIQSMIQPAPAAPPGAAPPPGGAPPGPPTPPPQ